MYGATGQGEGDNARAPLLCDHDHVDYMDAIRNDDPDGGINSEIDLLPEGDQNREIKIEIPALPSDLQSNPNHIFHDEPLKTFYSLLFLGFGFLVTTFSLAITHERVPEYPPLPDLVLDNTTYHPALLTISEIIIIVSTAVGGLVCVFHHHRMIVFRRVFLLLGLLYIYRGMTMFVTVLPISDPNYTCAPKLNHTITFVELLSRVATIVSGGGLSMNGKQIYCGDFIFSGHTMVLLLGFFVVREYSPRRFLLLHICSFLLTVAGVVMLLISRGHYSIDVLIAYWVTSRVWWTYHTLANNQVLKMKGDHNYMDNICWWYFFRYFETNIPAAVPRVYSFPIPRSLRDKLVDHWQRLRGSHEDENRTLL